MTAFVVAVVARMIVFMAINVSAQKLSFDATFIYCALSLTNMICFAVTILGVIQLFCTNSFAFTTCLVAILNSLRVDFELFFQLKQSRIYNLLEIAIIRQKFSQIIEYKCCSLL